MENKRVRRLSIGISATLYTAFAIFFGIRLNKWNDTLPGKCYNASLVSSHNAKHPLVDQIYLGVTSFYVFVLGFCATPYHSDGSPIIFGSQSSGIGTLLLQFVLHMYTVIALRVSNQHLLDNAKLEEQWGFGQILALVMLGTTLLECAKGVEGEKSRLAPQVIRYPVKCSSLIYIQNIILGGRRKNAAQGLEERDFRDKQDEVIVAPP